MNKLTSLVGLLQKKEMSAFDEFYNLTKRLVFFNVYGLVKNHDDAEDLLQETYIRFLNRVEEFDTKKPVLAYLLTISRNLSLNFLKERQKVRGFKENEDVNIAHNDRKSFEQDELIRNVQVLLKPKEFVIVYLKVVEDRSHQEISQLLNKPLGTITWAYNNAMKKLRKGLKDRYGK